jgi:acylpyruvate hydrolase
MHAAAVEGSVMDASKVAAGPGLAAFRVPGEDRDRGGVVVGDRVVDLSAALGNDHDGRTGIHEWRRAPGRLELFLAVEGWPELVATAQDGPYVPLAEVVLRPPVTRPQKIIGVGLNYLSHADEAARDAPEYPVLFAKFPNTLTGPTDDVPIPRASHRIDYEGELAVVIGRRTRYATPETADAAVAGYAVANDVSARDYQFRTKEMLQGKSFDAFCPLGPWITKPRAAHDLASLALTTHVNGEQRQKALLGEMLFDVPFLIAYISEIMTLEPGDVILTGTPAGIGGGMKPRRWLRDGDRVDIEISEIGRIVNRFVAPAGA